MTCLKRLCAGRPQLLTCGYSGPCQLVALERTTLEALSLQKLQDLATDLPYVATATRQVRVPPGTASAAVLIRLRSAGHPTSVSVTHDRAGRRSARQR